MEGEEVAEEEEEEAVEGSMGRKENMSFSKCSLHDANWGSGGTYWFGFWSFWSLKSVRS
jgi:hypothetical protein